MFSGVGLHANILINFLIQEGHSVTVIVSKNQIPADLPSTLIIKSVNEPLFNLAQARWLFLSCSFSKALKELEAVSDFDLIHFTDVRESYFCRAKAPMIGNINDTYSADLQSISYYRKLYKDWLFRWLYYFMDHQIEARRLPKLDCVIANSRYTYETVINEYPKCHEKVALCYKSVDINRYKNIFQYRLSAGYETTTPVILFIGGNMQRKGVPDLINAAPYVVQKYPNVKFVIIGRDKATNDLMNKCKKLNVLQNFLFTGWRSQDDILEFYKQATLYVMPSLTEALGVVFLEAMAAGVPVIGTEVGGIPEIIQNNITGILVPVNSPNELAKAINDLLSDEKKRKRMAKRAHEVVNKFSIENMMNCTQNIYQEVAKKHL